jgi:hypothetical protein
MHLWDIERLTCPSYHTVICQPRYNLSDAKPSTAEFLDLHNGSLFGWFWFKRLPIRSKASTVGHLPGYTVSLRTFVCHSHCGTFGDLITFELSEYSQHPKHHFSRSIGCIDIL